MISIWSAVVYLCLPDTIHDSHFPTEKEKQYAENRVVLGGTGRVDTLNSRWKPEQFRECLMDQKTYFFATISVLTQIPNGGTGSFGNLALTSFGFPSLQSTLVTLPASFIAMSTILLTGMLASRFKSITTFLLIAVVIPSVIGSALIFSVGDRGVRLFAYYCLQTGPSAIPLTLGLLSANYKGVTKKMTIIAFLFLTYCAGNIAGPQTFLASEKEREYPTAFKAIIICYGLVVLFSMGLRMYLLYANNSRDRIETTTDVDANVPAKPDLVAEDYKDTTDFKRK